MRQPTRKRKSKKIAVADIESNKWINFVCIGLYDGETFRYFKTLEKFFSHITEFQVIYFHFGGKFDFLFLCNYCQKKNIIFVASLIGSRIHSLKIGDVLFLDSFSLFSTSLEKMANSLFTKHRKTKIEHDEGFTFTPENLAYLENDCLVLWECIEKLKELSGEIWGNTTSAIAYKTFNKYFVREGERAIFKMPEFRDRFFRENLFIGGRTEIFKRYSKNLNYYDVNSLYPFAMLKNKMGTGKIYSDKRKSKMFSWYKIKLEKETNFYAPPFAVRKNKKLFFVNGKAGTEFYISTNEMEILDRENIPYKILMAWHFTEYSDLFSDYVYHYFDLKNSAKNEARNFYKLLLNGLYGKFAEKERKSYISNYLDTSKENNSVIEIGNGLYEYSFLKYVPNSRIQVASQITNNARAILYEHYEKINFDIHYSDTDSILTEKTFPTGEGLGELKKENEGEFIGLVPKFYYINGKVTHKGFTESGFSREDFMQALNENNFSAFDISYKTVFSFKESYKRNLNFLTYAEKTKHLVGLFDKRRLLNDNINTEAWTL